MAGYKVIFRDDRPAWQPGCPVQVATVQVSRNTETAQCYLQLKLRNVSNARVGRMSLTATITTPDGESSQECIELLDADIEPGTEITPKAIELPIKEVLAATASIESADGASDWSAPAPLSKPEKLELSAKAAAERASLAREAKVADSTAKHEEHDGWWLCQCGAINVERETCHACGARLENLANWEDETWLEESANKRAYEEATNLLTSRQRKNIESARQKFTSLGEYEDSVEQIATCDEALANLDKSMKKRKLVGIPIAALAIVAVLVVCLLVPSLKYSDAQKLADNGEYYAACEEFSSLNGFSDSSSKASSLIKDHPEAFVFAKSKETEYDLSDGSSSGVKCKKSFELGSDGSVLSSITEWVSGNLSGRTIDFTYSYDSSGEPTSVAATENGNSLSDYSYSYTTALDTHGRLKTISYKSGTTTYYTEYKYADDGTVKEVAKTNSRKSNSDISATDYKNGFRTIEVYSSSSTSYSIDYNTIDSSDSAGRPTQITAKKTGGGGGTTTYTFEYDGFGNITKRYKDGKLEFEYEWTHIDEPTAYVALQSSIKF